MHGVAVNGGVVISYAPIAVGSAFVVPRRHSIRIQRTCTLQYDCRLQAQYGAHIPAIPARIESQPP